jgi:hypothetical protein
VSWTFVFGLYEMEPCWTSTEFAVLNTIAHEAGVDGVAVDVTYEEIAYRSGCTRRTAFSVMRALERHESTRSPLLARVRPSGELLRRRRAGHTGRAGNTFQCLWPSYKKKEATAPFSPQEKGKPTTEKREVDAREKVQPTTDSFSQSSPRRSSGSSARGAPSSDGRPITEVGDARTVFESGCGLDVRRWQHEKFVDRLVTFEGRAAAAAHAELLRGYQAAIAVVRTSGAVPGMKQEEFWWAWFNQQYGTLRVTNHGRESHAAWNARMNAELKRRKTG